jgi:hypothetical protein
MAYAEKTEVAVEKSIAEIISMVKRSGAQRVMQYEEPESFTIQFELRERMVKFRVVLPTIDQMPRVNGNNVSLDARQRLDRLAQAHRQKARALMLVIKAKLESVESKVESFEQAFLPNVVLADGKTVYERIKEPIAIEYQTAKPSMLLLGGPAQ